MHNITLMGSPYTVAPAAQRAGTKPAGQPFRSTKPRTPAWCPP